MVLKCLVAAEDVPTNVSGGLLKFNHERSGLPEFTTCGKPVVTFYSVRELQDYKVFEAKMCLAIIGAQNYFGRV